MKKLTIILLFLAVSATSFSQQITATALPVKTNYMKKSKHQKTVAWILAGTGVGLAVTVFTTNSGKEYAANALVNAIAGNDYGSLNTIGTLLIIGGISTLSSIPLFIAAHRNKKKGISLSFKNESTTQLQKNSFVSRSVPSLSLKICL